ncbi:4-hydroxy-tetrahydrodipicolinate synthase [Clostridium sp. MCC353]|uniref:4-hydroxy-tetrahydrodipicolinate synthase n=1 Tax=Clostridium sp. MCC353 TaxID=2592646 RepID=UPI001C00F524|nr:4-hydroxy-tetrahydrodipicolinate synthase [Clostridium sp. MCC353]
MKNTIFKGVGTAIVTPMDESGNIDFVSLGRLLEFQLGHGADAIIAAGTTGESAVLEDWEIIALAEYVIRYVDHRIPVIVGTGSNNTAHSIFLSKEAENLGADGLLLVTPYYNKTSQKGLVQHFTAIGDSVDLPMIIYNVPSRTGMDINPETYLELSAHPNICGIKEASGNFARIAETAGLCEGRLDLYSGNDNQTLPVLALGGHGVISVLGNLMPEEMHDLCCHYFSGKVGKSRRLQLSLLDLMNALFSDVNPIPVKSALSMMGICGDFCRLPLIPFDGERKEELRKIMEKHGLISSFSPSAVANEASL